MEVDLDWLSDDETQMQAEDMLWEAVYAQRREKLIALAKIARVEIAAGITHPMFDERGEFSIE